MIEIDLAASAAPAAVAQEIIAAALFLNDERFPDRRYPEDIEEGQPRSFENCIAGALFLEQVLAACDPPGAWHAVFGRTAFQWHAFVLGRAGIVADVTGDQFGFAAAVLKPLAQAADYSVTGLLEDAGCVDIADRRTVRRWTTEWKQLRERYRAQAVSLLAQPGAPSGSLNLPSPSFAP